MFFHNFCLSVGKGFLYPLPAAIQEVGQIAAAGNTAGIRTAMPAMPENRKEFFGSLPRFASVGARR